MFPGIELVYNDMHMSYCNKHQQPAANVMEINYCKEGRSECLFGERRYCYMSAGDISFCSLHDSAHQSEFPTAHYHGIRGLYVYESDDSDSGEFTYFCMAPDTSATTYHIEFRYGSDLDALGKYDAGNYAYWLASGISTGYDQTMIENCIQLFCTENLSE